MRIAIIGGAGFIGTRLSRRLDNSIHNFEVYDKDTSFCKKASYLDIEDPTTLSKIDGSDIIINLAAEHRDDVRPLSRYDDVNVQGSINICDAARKHGINKIVFTSSVAIYGFASPDTDESGTPNYFNEYGRTKYLAEKVFEDWQSEDPENRTLVILRPTVVFGEGNRGNVYNLLNQIAKGMFVMFGNGMNKKSMAYVENVAAFLEYSLDFSSGVHIYNYIDKPDFDMNALVSNVRNILYEKKSVGVRLPGLLGYIIGYIADVAAKLTGKNFPISRIRVKKFMTTTQFSSSISNTNFTAPVSLEDGLDRTVRYEFMEDNSDKRTFETE